MFWRRCFLFLVLLLPLGCHRGRATQAETGATGAVAQCAALQKKLDTYVDANRSCSQDSDCVVIGSRACHQSYVLSTKTGNATQAKAAYQKQTRCWSTVYEQCSEAWSAGDECGGSTSGKEGGDVMCTASFNYIAKACVSNRCQDDGDGYASEMP